EEAAKLLQEHFTLRYAASEQEETLKKSALRSILRYLNMWREDFSLSVKTERTFEMDLDNALLTGTIDLLKRENGSSDILEIIDFKTGNDRKDREALDLQVQLYTLAARNALDLDVRKAYVHFLDDHRQPRLEILTTPKQLDLAMRTLSDAVKGITTRRFKRNPRSSRSCTNCDWEKICPKKKK
ncbi:MAG TPA: PD-(D/E)XK nuclease family protein, partial [Syntrophales bacterium]|nr:PD-(D/E)XK nuclease family protein [Syntrophales bacterium]